MVYNRSRITLHRKGCFDMGFKRAQWHSGLTYQQTCETCKTVLQYTDYSLDFRPWYADGFVYCPKCKTPLRHNENYAINPRPAPTAAPAPAPAPVAEKPAYMVTPSEQAGTAPVPVAAPAPTPAPAPAQAPVLPAFCTNCGNKYGPNDRFCPMCGNKRG